MPPQLAIFVYAMFVVLLFRHATRRGWSKELWIPLIWFFIVGSKPVGLWLAVLTGTARGPEGSNLDTAIYLGLLFAALRILARRQMDWHAAFRKNSYLFVYFAYAGLSICWSDYPFSSLKLWVKDAGNIVMALLLLSQKPVGDGARATLVRAAYILIPLSILLVKYFPELGRTYDQWLWRPIMVGASESKNALGAITAVCGLGLVWSVMDRSSNERSTLYRHALSGLIIAAGVWLLLVSNCATALACAIIGVVLIVVLRKAIARRLLSDFGLSVFILVPLVILVLHFFVGIGETAFGSLGRDSTLTGRTPIWDASWNENSEVFFGAGYCSFWRSAHAPRISEKLGLYYTLKEAHNGYLETYLNGGLVGFCLLMAAFISSTRRVLAKLPNGGTYAAMRLVLIVVALLYNCAESAFSGLNAIWLSMLLALLEYPVKRPVVRQPRTPAPYGEMARPEFAYANST